MNITSKMVGVELRRIFAALRRPMGWNLIDAFARLEEPRNDRAQTWSGSTTTRSFRPAFGFALYRDATKNSGGLAFMF